MTDSQILLLLEHAQGAPRLAEFRRRYIYVEALGVVIVETRIGKGERWAFSPSRDLVRLEDGKVPHAKAWMFSTPALRWVYRAARMNFVAHGLAMAERTL